MSEPHVTSSYRWVIIAAGALMTCVGIGAMFSLAIFSSLCRKQPAGPALASPAR